MTEMNDAEAERVYRAASSLWVDAQELVKQEDVEPVSWGLGVKAVRDTAIAEASEVDLGSVRAWLREFDGSVLVVSYAEQPTLTVKALIIPA